MLDVKLPSLDVIVVVYTLEVTWAERYSIAFEVFHTLKAGAVQLKQSITSSSSVDVQARLEYYLVPFPILAQI